jgi:2-oxoglutarate dehydrogenase E2 component (dihydrolipoamide succinyltransferase)
MPAAERLMAERGLTPADMVGLGSGPGGRVLKEDVQRAQPVAAPAPKAPAGPPAQHPGDVSALEEAVPMSPIRRKIAERLVQSKQEMAQLTTFNEIDMSNVMALRKQYQDKFTEKYGIKLGFMSFFVKAAIDALKLFPQVNAEIRGHDIVYKNYYDIGIAVGGGKGLAVPVLRGADRLSFAECELAIADFGKRAAENKLALEEFLGGTFTISNGGVYGSLMSTPIVNPPQGAILGLHAIQERAVVRDGQVVIRPMMYVAVSYDHRLIDGRESVTFLRRIKDCMEDPARMLVEV